MSWRTWGAAMADDALTAAALDGLARHRTDIIALARVASVAAVVEPALLRRLRLETPGLTAPGRSLHAGVEADLWFSRLAHVATAEQLTLRPAVAEELRRQLSAPQHQRMARAARHIVADAHAGHPDMIRLEERVIWSVITGDEDDAGRALDRALAAIRLGPDRAADVVRWVMQARRRLPAEALRQPAGRRLLAAVAMHTDRVVPADLLRASRFPDAIGNVAPTGLPVTTVGVELMAGGIRFVPGDQPNAASLPLPDTRPLVVEAQWGDEGGGDHSAVIIAQPGSVAALDGLSGPVVLRTIAGRRFRVRPARAREVAVAAFGMGSRGRGAVVEADPGRIASMIGLPDVTVRIQHEPADLYGSKPEVLVIGPQVPGTHGVEELAAAFARAAERARVAAGARTSPGTLVLVGVPRSGTEPARPEEPAALPPAAEGDAPGPDATESPAAQEAAWWDSPPYRSLRHLNAGRRSGTDELIASAVRGVIEHPARMYQLDVGSALAMLQSLALGFHVRAFYGEEVGIPGERLLFDLSQHPSTPAEEIAAARFRHVKGMCEWLFTGPVQDYLDGGEDPTTVDPGPPGLSYGEGGWLYAPEGWSGGRRWESFPEYLTWFIDELHHYAELMRDRLAPRLLINRYAVGEALEACRLALGTAALPLGHDRSAEPGAGGERTVYAVERARLPGLITALAEPVLAAARAADAERRADPASRPFLEPAPGVSVNSVAFFPDGRSLATAGADHTARICDVAARRQQAVLRDGQHEVDLLAIAPDGTWLATAGASAMVRIWDTGTLRQRSRLMVPSRVVALAIGPDGTWLATATATGTVQTWDTATLRQRSTLTVRTDPVTALAAGPDGTWLATADASGTVQIWDAATMRELAIQAVPSDPVTALAAGPDGTWLATAGTSGTVRIWDILDTATLTEGVSLTGHAGPVNHVAVAPDGRTLASGGDDHTVRLWDPVAGAALGDPFTGHTGAVNAVAFGAGFQLASASADGTVRFWDAPARRAAS